MRGGAEDAIIAMGLDVMLSLIGSAPRAVMEPQPCWGWTSFQTRTLTLFGFV